MVTPALIWPGFDPVSRKLPKAASKRLARAARREIAARDPLGLAAVGLGIDPPPAAALARLADGLEPEGRNWLRAEPVALVPDRDALALLPLTAAPLERDEEDTLADVARKHFGNVLTLERGPSGRWYAAIERVREATGAALDEVKGRALDVASLASGPDAPRLRAFLTELQMLWFDHPVNTARRAAGRPEASGLWLWGGGRLPAKPQIEVPVSLRTDVPELVGLARWLDLECESLSEPEAGMPREGVLAVIGPEEETTGEAWLDRFTASRGEFRVYAAGVEWRIPARRSLFRWPG